MNPNRFILATLLFLFGLVFFLTTPRVFAEETSEAAPPDTIDTTAESSADSSTAADQASTEPSPTVEPIQPSEPETAPVAQTETTTNTAESQPTETSNVPEPAASENTVNETQDTDYSCGPAALVTWIKLLGGQATEAELILQAKTNAEEGTTFFNLRNAAIAKGYINATVYKLTLANIGRLSLPALVYLNVEGSEIGHYAVLYKVEGDNFYLHDPTAGDIVKTRDEFSTDFGKYAMINGAIRPPPAVPAPAPSAEVEGNSNAPAEQTVAANEPEAGPAVASDDELCTVKGKGFFIPVILWGLRYVGGRYLGVRWLGIGVKLGYHTKLNHYFPRLGGYYPHFQVNVWRDGVDGSGWAKHIPFPWW